MSSSTRPGPRIPPPAASGAVLEMYKEDAPAVVLERIRVGKRRVHSFGRNEKVCSTRLDHGSISRQHAIIVHAAAGGVYLVDLHSSLGSAVNGNKVEAGVPVRLHDDDVLSFGASSRRYRLKASGSLRDAPDQHNGSSSSHSSAAADGDGAATDGHTQPPTSSTPSDDRKRPRSPPPAAATADSSASEDKRQKTAASSSSPAASSPQAKIRASHILLKHVKSRRPSSHHSDNITRRPDEARTQLLALRAELAPLLSSPLQSSLLPAFSALATQHSDCSSYKRGGDLGSFRADRMQREFSAVAFALDVGQLSDVVETESGMHLILRTE